MAEQKETADQRDKREDDEHDKRQQAARALAWKRVKQIALGAIGILIGWGAIILSTADNGLKWNEFGDSFAPAIGLLTAFTLAAAIASTLLQWDELGEQRRQLMLQRREIRLQRRELRLQRNA